MAAAGRFHRRGGHLYTDRFRPEGCRRHHVAADGVLVAACLLPLVTIFLFKRRLVQIRLCAVELVLLVGAGAMMGIYFYLCNRYFAESEFYSHTLKISLVFPLVCLVFDLLALRAIFRDEKLVRSLDRIR